MSDDLAVIKTAPHDKKNFPATNQAGYCWQLYNSYVLCLKKTNGDEDACNTKKLQAHGFCLEEWTTAWDEQRRNGNFLGIQEKPVAKHH